MDASKKILEFGEGLKQQFNELDKLIHGSGLSDEQKAGLLKTRVGLESAIANQDENAILETVKKHLDGSTNNG